MIVFLALVILLLCGFYRYEIRPVDKSGEDISFNIKEGDTWYSIGSNLYEMNLINSYKFYKIYIKLFRPGNLEAGTYTLSSKMSLPEIIDTLENGKAINPNLINITFKEGFNMRAIANVIEKNTDNTYEDVFKTLEDSDYIKSLITDYWFLDDIILDEKIYYPLEGYLFPSTYQVDKTKSVKEIFKSMLDEMDKELTKYKKDIESSGYTVHEILTMASIVELEAGTAKDRADVSGVFYNRMKTPGETLGSDVTAYYGAKMDDWTNGLGNAEILCNAYNTRLNSKCPINGLPIGPISSPSDASIKAAINPNIVDSFFFVADCSGKTYLSKTYSEHISTINKLKNEGNWCDN